MRFTTLAATMCMLLSIATASTSGAQACAGRYVVDAAASAAAIDKHSISAPHKQALKNMCHAAELVLQSRTLNAPGEYRAAFNEHTLVGTWGFDNGQIGFFGQMGGFGRNWRKVTSTGQGRAEGEHVYFPFPVKGGEPVLLVFKRVAPCEPQPFMLDVERWNKGNAERNEFTADGGQITFGPLYHLSLTGPKGKREQKGVWSRTDDKLTLVPTMKRDGDTWVSIAAGEPKEGTLSHGIIDLGRATSFHRACAAPTALMGDYRMNHEATMQALASASIEMSPEQSQRLATMAEATTLQIGHPSLGSTAGTFRLTMSGKTAVGNWDADGHKLDLIQSAEQTDSGFRRARKHYASWLDANGNLNVAFGPNAFFVFKKEGSVQAPRTFALDADATRNANTGEAQSVVTRMKEAHVRMTSSGILLSYVMTGDGGETINLAHIGNYTVGQGGKLSIFWLRQKADDAPWSRKRTNAEGEVGDLVTISMDNVVLKFRPTGTPNG